jgi:magnesium chelatase family protein
MLAKVNTAAMVGMDALMVEVEVDISPGLPATFIVGLPDTAVKEARDRVRAAIRNAGCAFPMRIHNRRSEGADDADHPRT